MMVAGESLLICMGSVVFQAAVTDAVGTIVREVSEDPPANVEKLLLSSPAVNEVEVPQNQNRCQVNSQREELLRYERLLHGTSNRLERRLRRQSKHDYLTWCLANSSGVYLPAFT